jgi:hypothetical protein
MRMNKTREGHHFAKEKTTMKESLCVYKNNTPANEERVPKNTQELIQEEFNFAPTGEENLALDVFAEDFQASQERAKIEQAWMNAKDGNLAMLDSEGANWDSSTHIPEGNIQIPEGFSFDESTECYTDGCTCSRNHA